jgi:membrane fusion protein, multidrug efflux system
VVKSGLRAEDQIVIEGLANPAVRPGVKVMPKLGQIVAASQ